MAKMVCGRTSVERGGCVRCCFAFSDDMAAAFSGSNRCVMMQVRAAVIERCMCRSVVVAHDVREIG